MTKKIIQVAGFSNSGKTTLVAKLVSLASTNGLRVGTIKHHGHGGELTSLDEGKDSWKHRQAGAYASTTVSKGMLQLQVCQDHAWELNELLTLYQNITSFDVIIIEGFKASSYPKIVMIKHEEDLKLLAKLENIFCVISWFDLPSELKNQDITYFHLNDEGSYLDVLIQKMKG